MLTTSQQFMHLIKETLAQRSQSFRQLTEQQQSCNTNDLQHLKQRLQVLLRDKKAEAARVLTQGKLMQTLMSQKIGSSESIREFLQLSKEVMAMYGQDFKFQLTKQNQGKDPLALSIFVYIKFFQNNGNPYKASEILNAYKRNICEKELLLPTLLTWFIEWTRKQYTNLLKKTIRTLTALIQGMMMPRPQGKTLRQQLQSPTADNRISRSDTVAFFEMAPVTCEEGRYDDKQKEKQKDKFHINKQFFYGAYNKQMTEIYNFHGSVLGDLDFGYLRAVRKVDMRKQILKNIPKTIESFIYSLQPTVKKQIDSYVAYYISKHAGFAQKFQKDKQQIQKKNNERMMQRRSKSPKKDFSNLLALSRQTSQSKLPPSKLLQSIPKIQYLSEIRIKQTSQSCCFEQALEPLIKHPYSKPLISKKYIQINLPSIVQKTHTSVQQRNESSNSKLQNRSQQIKSSHLFPQKYAYARNKSFSLREQMLDKPLQYYLHLQQKTEKYESQKPRYVSMTQKQQKRAHLNEYEKFTFGRQNKSIRLDDVIGKIAEATNPQHKVFCLPRLSKN